MREARLVMADLAASGLSPDQLALVMELSAALTVEARPTEDKSATRRRERDREYQAEKRRQNRQISADSADSADPSPDGFPPDPPSLNPNQDPPLSPRKKRKAVEFPEPPDWMPPGPWMAFCELRHGMHPKVPWSPDACQRVIAKIDRARAEGHCPTKLLDKAVENSHRTVFPDDETKAKSGNGAGSKPPMTTEELRRAIQFNEDQGNHEKAKAYRFQLEARQAFLANATH